MLVYCQTGDLTSNSRSHQSRLLSLKVKSKLTNTPRDVGSKLSGNWVQTRKAQVIRISSVDDVTPPRFFRQNAIQVRADQVRQSGTRRGALRQSASEATQASQEIRRGIGISGADENLLHLRFGNRRKETFEIDVPKVGPPYMPRGSGPAVVTASKATGRFVRNKL